MRKGFVVLVGAAVAGVAGYRFVVEPWWRTWGVDPDDIDRPLPGDDVVPEASIVDTRSIEIDAPAVDVWPWLVQMGFGRAGWYSYDAIDMRGASASSLMAEQPVLAVGDVVPTHPDGGFVVRGIDPGRSLTLFIDNQIAAAQAQEAARGRARESATNVKFAGSFMAASQPPEFAASWTFVIEPLEPGRSRLIERVRVAYGAGTTPGARLFGPAFGFGVFLMTRKQMIGIRERVEQNATLGHATA